MEMGVAGDKPLRELVVRLISLLTADGSGRPSASPQDTAQWVGISCGHTKQHRLSKAHSYHLSSSLPTSLLFPGIASPEDVAGARKPLIWLWFLGSPGRCYV